MPPCLKQFYPNCEDCKCTTCPDGTFKDSDGECQCALHEFCEGSTQCREATVEQYRMGPFAVTVGTHVHYFDPSCRSCKCHVAHRVATRCALSQRHLFERGSFLAWPVSLALCDLDTVPYYCWGYIQVTCCTAHCFDCILPPDSLLGARLRCRAHHIASTAAATSRRIVPASCVRARYTCSCRNNPKVLRVPLLIRCPPSNLSDVWHIRHVQRQRPQRLQENSQHDGARRV